MFVPTTQFQGLGMAAIGGQRDRALLLQLKQLMEFDYGDLS